jgi:hypothetical protein
MLKASAAMHHDTVTRSDPLVKVRQLVMVPAAPATAQEKRCFSPTITITRGGRGCLIYGCLKFLGERFPESNLTVKTDRLMAWLILTS